MHSTKMRIGFVKEIEKIECEYIFGTFCFKFNCLVENTEPNECCAVRKTTALAKLEKFICFLRRRE